MLLRVCEGTGHGVGAFLNVHEGPHGISSTIRKGPMMEIGLVPGMVVSNEPGYATLCFYVPLFEFMHVHVGVHVTTHAMFPLVPQRCSAASCCHGWL